MTTGRMYPGTGAASEPPTQSTATRAAVQVSGRMPAPSTAVTGPVVARMPLPEINPTPWGFIKNLTGDVGELVQGLGTLFIKAPVHDMLQLGANILPGEQTIEQEPSMLATVARTMLPGAWFPGPDLGGKWGGIAGDYARRYGGLSNIARGLYEDPLSYVMDALMLADGIGLVGKAGRTGAVLSHAPQLVSDDVASKILGPALEVGAPTRTGYRMAHRYGGAQYGSLSRGGAGTETLKLSSNPLVRGVQGRIYKSISSTPEEAGLLEGIGDLARTQEAIKLAEQNNLRILNPRVGKYLAEHETSKLLSALRVRTSDHTATEIAMLDDLTQAGKQVEDPLTGEMREVSQTDAAAIYNGLSAPTHMPDNQPIVLGHTLPMLNRADVPQVSAYDPAAAQAIAQRYAYKPGSRRAARHDVPGQESIVAPGGEGQNSFQVAVASLDDADRVGQEAVRAAGYEPMGVWDALRYGENPVDELSYYGRKGDEVIKVTVGTPNMLYQQAAALPHMTRIAAKQQELAGLIDDLSKLSQAADPSLATKLAAQIDLLKTEAKAGREYVRSLFDDTRATYHAAHDGQPYLPEVAAAYRTRAWMSRNVVEKWFKESKSASYTKMMERAYGPARVERLYQVLGQFAPDFRAILEDAMSTVDPTPKIRAELDALEARAPRDAGGGFAFETADRQRWEQLLDQLESVPEGGVSRFRTVSDDEVYLNLIHYLEGQGVPEPLVQEILGTFPWRGAGGQRNLDSAVQRLVKRARNALWDYAVIEGGHGAAFGFDPWDWRIMHDQRIASNLPIPSYMPHLPTGKRSEYFKRGAQAQLTAPSPGIFRKNWEGLLLETGRADMDLHSALQRAAAISIKHSEMKNFVFDTLAAFGRPATARERTLAERYGDARYVGERYYNPEQIRASFDLRGELMAKTVAEIPDSDILTATMNSLEDWGAKVAEEGLNGMTKGTLMAVPEYVAKMIEREVKLQLGNTVKLFWDTPMKVWKAAVLSLSPRWIVNNLFGNLMFVGIENPGALRHVLSQMDARNRAFVESIIGADPLEINESGFFHDVGAPTEGVARLGPKAERTKRFVLENPASQGVMKFSRGVRSFNSYIEEGFRNGILVDELSRGRLQRFGADLEKSTTTLQKLGREGFTPSEINTSLQRVDRVIGNFMRYSPVEQGIIRRFFMPFYGFYRHMVNVILRLPIEHPLKASVARQIALVDQVMEAELPDYLKGQNAIPLGDLFGGDSVLRLKNANPLSAWNDDFPLVSMLNPGVKMLIERSLGVNTFTGQPFDIPDELQGSLITTHDGQLWQVQRDGAGNVIGVERSGPYLPSLLTHVGSQFGPLSALPMFQLYPKSAAMQVASWAGASITQPAGGMAAAQERDANAEAEAMAIAQDTAGGFGDFGSFGSF